MIPKFLKAHLPSVFFGTVFALGLGVVSALLGVLIGPSVSLLMGPRDPDSPLQYKDMFGERLGPWFQDLVGAHIQTQGDFFTWLPFLLLMVAGLRATFGSSQWFIWERLGERLSRKIRQQIITAYLKLFPQALIESPELDANVSSVVGNDVKYVREYLVRFYGGLPREALQVLFMVGSLYLLSPSLLAMFVFGVAPVLIIIRRLGKLLRRRAKAAMQSSAVLNDWLQQRFLGLETIKHLRTEEHEIALAKQKNQELFHNLLRAETLKAATSPLIEFVSFFSVAVVLGVALQRLFNNEVSGAVQLSFFSTLGLLSQGAGKLGKYYNTNKEAQAALHRIEELLKDFERNDEQKFGVAHHRKISSKISLQCEKLGFSYPGTGYALRHLDYHFDGGKIYGIAGSSGAGKSTLLRLLLGVLIPSEGKITLSIPSAESTLIGYLPQRPLLIADSVMNNVIYPDQTGDREKVRSALRAVGLSDAVENVEGGLDAKLGLDGSSLSGGQEQRIHLARLLYHRYPVVLIDEGTSALDAETEHLALEAFKELASSGSLVVMIAHRKSALSIADQVLTFERGRLV